MVLGQAACRNSPVSFRSCPTGIGNKVMVLAIALLLASLFPFSLSKEGRSFTVTCEPSSNSLRATPVAALLVGSIVALGVRVRTLLAQAGRSALHAGVRSALADITLVAFRLPASLRATANLSWRGLHSYFRAEQLQCHMTRGWRTVIHWT